MRLRENTVLGQVARAVPSGCSVRCLGAGLTLLLIAVDADRAPAQQLAFRHVVVDDSGPLNPWGKSVGDLNGDGLPELVVGGSKAGGLVYYENPSWRKRTIAADGRWSTDHECVDLDGDGDLDVVALTTTTICWLENPDWEMHVIDRIVLHDIEVADLDNDGDYDLVGRDQGEFGHSGKTLHFYRQDSLSQWRHRKVECPDGEGLRAADIDGDQDIDVVINSVWFENSGEILTGLWQQHHYAARWLHAATFVTVADVNLDGRVDVVLSPSELAGDRYRISWFEAPDNPATGDWVEHPIALNVESVHHFVGAADLDLDGDVDVVTAEMQQGQDPDEVQIYRNAGDCVNWDVQVIARTGSHSMRLVDIEGDGDIDLFCANHQGEQVDLWINETRRAKAATQNLRHSWHYIEVTDALPARCFGIAAADIDGDGDQDLAIGDTPPQKPRRRHDGELGATGVD